MTPEERDVKLDDIGYLVGVLYMALTPQYYARTSEGNAAAARLLENYE